MTTVRRALALSFMERYFSIMVALGSNMLLARLLTPEQIGMYSVSLAVIGIAHVLREFGVGNFLIQQKDLNDNHVRTAFGLALVLGGTLALVIFAIAPWAARFYDAPEMAGLMRIVALNFLVLPFCSISLSLLRREMKFKALLYVSLCALLSSTAVTLSLSWAGFGPTSLAVGSVVGNVATGFGAWWARGRPALLRPGWREWRVVLNFGGQSAATGIVTSVAMDINDLVVGKVLGFAPVAMLSRAQGLMNLFHRDVMGAVRNVALPAFAQAHRQGHQLSTRCGTAVSMVTLISWPFYFLISVFSLEVIRILFGSQWDAAARLVPYFCAAGALSSMTSLTSSAAVAVGRIELVTISELILQPLKIAIIVGAVLIYKDMQAAAIAYTLSAVVSAPALLYVVEIAIKGSAKAILSASLTSLWVAVPSVAPALLVAYSYGFERQDSIPILILSVTVTLTFLLIVLFAELTKHPLIRDSTYISIRTRLLVSIVRLRQ